MLFLGMTGGFSLPPLQALIDAGIPVTAVALPSAGPAAIVRRHPPVRSRSGLAVLQPYAAPNIVHLAWQRGIPVFELSRPGSDEALEALRAFPADVLAVACFSLRLPERFRRLGRTAAVNVHPSLLPRNRGPEPLFWTFREGLAETGVTVHLLTDRLDAGSIVQQRRITVEDGLSGAELEARCASAGAGLLVKAVRQLCAGSASLREQDEADATYHPAPGEDDFVVDGSRSARWAFNFIRGAGWLGHPIHILTPDLSVEVVEAVSFEDSTLGRPYELRGRRLRLQCSPGILTVRLA